MAGGGSMTVKIPPRSCLALALTVAALGAPTSASALTCYIVLDRNDNVVYRDTYPPLDLSDQGTAQREQMRRRGEHLIAMESDRCPALQFFLGNAGSTNLNVDQTVGGMPVPGASGAAPATGAKPSGAPAPAQPPARNTAPAKSS
jgi:hypothetical protein